MTASYATARQVDFAEIPILDLAQAERGPAALAALAADLKRAATEVGFFYLRGHTVPQDVMDATFAQSRAFFAQPLEVKQQMRVDARHRGFLRVGEAKMYRTAKADLKESYLYGLDLPETDPDVVAGRPLMGPNRWPADRPDLKAAVDAWFTAIRETGQTLLRVFAVALDLPPDHFAAAFAKPLARGSLLYYPPQPAEMGADQFGVSAHTDYGALTFVAQDDVGGLQVLNRSGEWIAAPPMPGCFVVNIGDLMARWSNDLFVSTPHRVVNASTRERYSMAVFFDPHPDTPIAAIPSCVPPGQQPLYPATTCGAHITGRFDAAFAYRKAANQS